MMMPPDVTVPLRLLLAEGGVSLHCSIPPLVRHLAVSARHTEHRAEKAEKVSDRMLMALW